ncbi:peptidyl-dipeptidase Dcp [Dysgonomonas sp. PH5-45]|uniref:M3 family metallopeptidase n=1 Tax=unclassified Dysgonomonas TaxID=2630389 RepID=UPI0024735890|nr:MULTISPECIES: M3 family metallopeptidase [unclassified Dysgonomonas]MDH6354289.1 peptidyl-dipeptidase Dcp [Dysgonomonas sp. PH5-45]MDH6387190.1 peptidyl-dipeptidase Dcp [Dysgonomonas sp. PH5-37]
MKKLLIVLSLLIMMYSCDSKKKDNPFFAEYETPNQLPPFDLIEIEHYKPAFEEGMKQQLAEIDSIVNNTEAPTFENTVLALDETGRLLDKVSSVFYSVLEADSDSTMQSLAEELSPILSTHADNINLNEKLFARIKTVYDDTTRKDLTTEQKRLTEKFYKSFVRSGIMLDAAQKDRMREINKELDLLSLNFGNNLLAENNNFILIVDKKDDLAGLPEDVVAAAAEAAKAKGHEGKWVFTLSKTSWIPFLQYADNRDLREKLYKAMYNRGDNDNEFDNKAIISKIVNLRLEKANLLGYKTYADFALEETMAKTPENAMNLLNSIWKYALPQAKKEAAELQSIIDREGGNFKLESWDWWYYTEKLRKEKYDLNEQALKPYFAVDNVREGVFMVANKLYGLNFKEITKDVPVYHKDVKAFEVSDANGYIGTIYIDNFARPSKRGGAWMGVFREQEVYKGQFITPIVYNVGNYPAPVGDEPSLLSLDEVTTIFHEFGHGLHGLLSKCTYKTLAGTNVSRDFVELPSQVLEHWALHPEVLKMYAKHYKTGEVIPEELINKIQETATFNQGFITTEIVAAAILDMKWYTITQKGDIDVRAFEKNALEGIGLIPEIIVRYRSTYFNHIFAGGYSAGYYSYLWSEVLDSDAFQAFEEKGIFDQATAKSFRENVLSKGNTDDPVNLYRKFRGADPNPIYMLKSRGFVK